MMCFLLFLAPLFFPFVYAFQRIIGGRFCLEQYDGFGKGIYNTFLVMINIVHHIDLTGITSLSI